MVHTRDPFLDYFFFLNNINNFSRASEKLFSILYADGTSVFLKGYVYDKLMEVMNNEII